MQLPKPERASVPCGKCRHCCRGTLLVLFPKDGDDLTLYEYDYMNLPDGTKVPVLKHKENGDCAYLGVNGCTIHDHAPVMCQAFDCRRWFLKFDAATRRKMILEDPDTKGVLEAGRQRLHTL
jgi:hypothetical protein